MGFIRANKKTCTGCRYCEAICSFNKEARCNPASSRIVINKDEENGLEKPVVCLQCRNPECVQACVFGALEKDAETGVVHYDLDKCYLCLACVDACRFKAIRLHRENGAIIKCELCAGDPACVKYCPTKSLTLVR